MRARYYDPNTGRFIQQDPLAGILHNTLTVTNRYTYAANNPINFKDPSGLTPINTIVYNPGGAPGTGTYDNPRGRGWGFGNSTVGTTISIIGSALPPDTSARVAYVEVIGWSGVGTGSSSFGHISVVVDSTSYSWGPGGLDRDTADGYISRNTKFRPGTGIVLNLSSAQKDVLVHQFLNHHGNYNFLTNNCGGPVQDALKSIGILSGSSSILPTNLMKALSTSPAAVGQTYHRLNPGATSHPSGWGNIYAP